MIVKVCGMRDAGNIRQAEQCGADWMGFIFYPCSPRFVGKVPGYLPSAVERVGVFVDERFEKIIEAIDQFALGMVQLHGSEPPGFCAELRTTGVQIIKAFSIDRGNFPHAQTALYEGVCDYFLFDTQTPAHGGSGKKFDWDALAAYRGKTPFLLSGGITPGDAEEILAFAHPMFCGIDLNSRFEDAPAQKSIPSLQAFINKIRRR